MKCVGPLRKQSAPAAQKALPLAGSPVAAEMHPLKAGTGGWGNMWGSLSQAQKIFLDASYTLHSNEAPQVSVSQSLMLC